MIRPFRVLAVIGAALVLMIGGAVAYAQIPSADGTITGCYMKSGGAIRVIDAPSQKCKSGETQLTWNQHGQPGINGTNGAPGTNGTNGVSGYEIVTENVDLPENASGFGSQGAACPAGKKTISIGATPVHLDGSEFSGGRFSIDSSIVDTDGNGASLAFEFDTTVIDYNMRIRLVCAAVN